MKLEISYAEMSFLRDLIHKYKYERWKQQLKIMNILKNKDGEKLDSEDMEDLRKEFWNNYDKDTPITDECCAVLIGKKIHMLELECQIALGMQQPAKMVEKVMPY